MIITASRRTDIPAFYSEWFFNRLKAGYILSANPYNPKQVKRITLTPHSNDVIVFWTKNALPMLNQLERLSDHHFFFHYTLNPYQQDIEETLPKIEKRVEIFKALANKIGYDKIIWRYDPILLTDKYTLDYHQRAFTFLCEQLHDYTPKVIISFIDQYVKIKQTLQATGIYLLSQKEMEKIAEVFSKIAKKHQLPIETCGETIDLDRYNIKHGKCIDPDYINQTFNTNLIYEKDPYQRETCLCMKSIDIGAYNTCMHFCKYCYANYDKSSVLKKAKQHDPHSPLLIGNMNGTEKIKPEKIDKNLFNLDE